MIANIQAVDAGMKGINITVEINDKDVIVTTPYEKIYIPKKEFDKLYLSEKKPEVKAEVKIEEPPVDKWARKEKNNA
jgi:hypothetical protein